MDQQTLNVNKVKYALLYIQVKVIGLMHMLRLSTAKRKTNYIKIFVETQGTFKRNYSSDIPIKELAVTICHVPFIKKNGLSELKYVKYVKYTVLVKMSGNYNKEDIMG